MTRPSRSRAKRLGRRLGVAALAALVIIPTAVWTLQIVQAVWWPPVGPKPASCREGLVALLSALDRARTAPRLSDTTERAALAEFRRTLEPEWATRPALGPLCEPEPAHKAMLRDIDGLRYAEEHAIRYESNALASQRQRARAIARELALSRGAPQRASP